MRLPTLPALLRPSLAPFINLQIIHRSDKVGRVIRVPLSVNLSEHENYLASTGTIRKLLCTIVIEIWRHGGGFYAMERSGAAAQNAKEWRESGSKISELTVEVTRTVFHPIAFTPLL